MVERTVAIALEARSGGPAGLADRGVERLRGGSLDQRVLPIEPGIAPAHIGAEVDGVCGTDNVELVCSLGATRVFDHQREDFRAGGESWDVILDPVGRTTFAASRTALRPGGRHVFLEFGLTEIVQALTTSVSGDRRVVIGVSGDTREDLDLIAGLLETGAVRPVIDGLYPLERIVEAHARVESRHKRGSVVVTVVEGP